MSKFCRWSGTVGRITVVSVGWFMNYRCEPAAHYPHDVLLRITLDVYAVHIFIVLNKI
jgi:hypothetical protein